MCPSIGDVRRELTEANKAGGTIDRRLAKATSQAKIDLRSSVAVRLRQMGKGWRGTVRTCCVPVTHISGTLPYCHRVHVTAIAYGPRFPLPRRCWRGPITEPSPDLLTCARLMFDFRV